MSSVAMPGLLRVENRRYVAEWLERMAQDARGQVQLLTTLAAKRGCRQHKSVRNSANLHRWPRYSASLTSFASPQSLVTAPPV